MMRPLALVFAATVLAGCKAPNGSIDPFLGRQTVPAPGTGVASTPPDASYYSAPQGSPVGSASSQPGSPYAPPGNSYNYSGGSASRGTTLASRAPGQSSPGLGDSPPSRTASPTAVGGVSVGSTSPADRPPGSGGAGRSAPPGSSFQVNTNSGVGSASAATTASRELQIRPSGPRTSQPQRLGDAPATNINDLPLARPRSQPPVSSGSSGSNGSSTFRPASSIKRASFEDEAADEQASEISTGRTPRRETIGASQSVGEYAYDRNYQSLKGRLEYSRIDDRWKLRYIPINGDTDRYGGSVVLLGSRLLEGYKPGELVTVHGAIDAADATDAGGFAPPFRLDQIERQ